MFVIKLTVPLTNVFAEEQKVEVIIVYRDEGLKEEKLSLFNLDEENEQFLDELNIKIASIDVSEIENLKNAQNVEAVSFNKKVELFESANTYVSSNNLEEVQLYNLELVNIYSAWDKGYTGKGIKIAVIDSGFAKHKDLKLAGGKSFISGKNYTEDNFGHGTIVVGIINALKNGKGIAGIAPNAKVYGLKVFDGKYAKLDDILKALNWSIKNNMDIVNMSFGLYDDDPTLKAAIKKVSKKGILMVAASGNDKREIAFPAAYDEVIAVSSIDEEKKISDFTNRGPQNELVAPGNSIYSTYLFDNYTYLSGTSMATPHVTGLLAILKQKFPNYSAVALRRYINDSAEDLGKVGRDNVYGYGLARYLEPTPSKISASNIKVINNSGKQDVIKLKNLEYGKIYSIYKDSKLGKKITSFKADKISKTIHIKQLSGKAGSIYITVKKSGYGESKPIKITYKAEKIPSISTKNVTITNYYKAKDKIVFKGLKKGYTYTIYSDKSLENKLISFIAKNTIQNIYVNQLGEQEGAIYIKVSKSGYISSSTTKVKFKGEPTKAIPAKNIKISNKKKEDTIEIKGLKKGTTVVIYKDAKMTKKIASFKATSSTKILKVKQLGKNAGKIYITAKAPGYSVSAITVKNYPNESIY